MQKLKITGGFLIPTGGAPVAPQARGVHLRVLGPTGAIVLDQHIPGGIYTPASPIGWKVATAKFNYLDKTVPPTQNGIKKITLTNKSAKVPGLFTFVITGDRGNYPLVPGESPITVALELNDTGNPQGSAPGTDQCGEVHFGTSVPPRAPRDPTSSPASKQIATRRSSAGGDGLLSHHLPPPAASLFLSLTRPEPARPRRGCRSGIALPERDRRRRRRVCSSSRRRACGPPTARRRRCRGPSRAGCSPRRA